MMETAAQRIQKLSFPGVLLAICILGFGLLIPGLAFFQDDWPILYYYLTGGQAGLWELHLYQSRPFAAFVYSAVFAVIGFSPLAWHVLAFLLRFLTALVFWFTFKTVWPESRQLLRAAILLFAIYPLFELQALAVTYTIHWVGYLLFALSMWSMVYAVAISRRPLAWLGLSVLLSGLHLILIEYYFGLELIRPLILWFLLSKQHKSNAQRLLRTALYWAPYALVLVLFGFYRLAWIPRPIQGFDQNRPEMLFDLLSSPVSTTLAAFELMLQEVMSMVFSVWGKVFSPEAFEISRLANLAFLLIAVAGGFLAALYLKKLPSESEEPDQSQSPNAQILLTGLAMTFLGPLPAWITYQSITFNNPLWSSRFGLGSMLGLSLLIVYLLFLVIQQERWRWIIFGVLIGATIAWHLRVSNEYRWSAISQQRFYYQLSWRIPKLQPGTALLSDGEIFSYMGEYPTSFAVSSLFYEPGDIGRDIDHWFFGIHKHFGNDVSDLISGEQISDRTYSALFNGSSLESIIIHYAPDENQCLWVLGPQDHQIRILPEVTRELAVISNLSRIQIGDASINTRLFGREPEPGWCYYYQKADLARQNSNWAQVINLWNQAEALGLSPGNGVEYLPFIQAYAMQEDWQTALDMTRTARKITHVMSPRLCLLWQEISASMDADLIPGEVLTEINESLTCDL